MLCGLSDDAAGVLMLPGDGPDEAEQLPRDGGADLVLGHPPRAQTMIPSRKSFLRLPGDGLYGGRGPFGEALTQLVQLSTRLICQEGFEAHQRDHLGVDRYKRGEGRRGYRSGYEPGYLDTAEGRLEVAYFPIPRKAEGRGLEGETS